MDSVSNRFQDKTRDRRLFTIGNHKITAPTVLAPMAGVTDLPFRLLCRQFGAGLAASEMVTSDTSLWHTSKSRLRLPHASEPEPRMVQIAGGDPAMLANAAQQNVRLGAQIIDINMGCPAKKVCKRAAGSALLADEKLVAKILKAVVAAVAVPVTLKIRTGSSPEQRNGKTIARIAEDSGIQALAVHGRTRACKFRGQAEYDTIAEIVDSINIPVIANGDIDTPEKASTVLSHTGAAAVMIGRGAQGRPWLFREINHYLQHSEPMAPPSSEEMQQVMTGHLQALHQHYGQVMGVRIARKHLGWYLLNVDSPAGESFRQQFNQLTCPSSQLDAVNRFFEQQNISQERAA